MTLQQLRYVIRVAQEGSVNLAAQKLFISQPSLSNAIADLEREMGIVIFVRSNRGVSLTEEGTKFLSYARQVTEQVELLESEYKNVTPARRVFAVSAQHYAFVVNAFVALVKEYGGAQYEFSLRETRTHDIIEDVRTQRSELGILYLSNFNRGVISGIIKRAELSFESLFSVRPSVFLCADHPLAKQKSVTAEELKGFPRLSYEQGIHNSFYFAEEPLITEESPKSIVVSDRATLFNLLIGLNGYTVCTGILSTDLNGSNIVAVPLVSDERMEIGYVFEEGRPLSAIAERYLFHLREYISHCLL